MNLVGFRSFVRIWGCKDGTDGSIEFNDGSLQVICLISVSPCLRTPKLGGLQEGQDKLVDGD